MEIRLFKDNSGKWRFHIVAAKNGKVIACSEAYSSKAACRKTALKLQKVAAFEWLEIVE